MATHARRHDAYTIGWICALSKEQTAATAMLDERHQDLPKSTNDPNTYTFGSIGGHNIVIACLPEGKIGTNPAAVVASHMVHAFPAIRFGLLVGIGGGIPSKVRLGDVVVSVPGDQHPGVVQWDMGKAEQGGKFRRTGALNNPPTSLRTALTKLKTDHELEGSKISQYLEELQVRYPRLAQKYLRSDSLQDVLFKASYGHVEKQHSDGSEVEDDASEDDAGEDCRHCDKTQMVKRKPRDMRVHYGLIASGNQVIKDANVRDQLSKDMDKKILCVEMEAAGLMDNFPCIVIRGICDYADSHKNKAWQEHAAAVAAAFAKELLGYVQPQEVDQEKTLKDALAQVNETLVMISSGVENVQSSVEFMRTDKHGDDIMKWLGAPDVSSNLNKALQTRHPGSGQRLIQGEAYRKWRSQPRSFLWLHGIPGCGKTVLTSTVIEDLKGSQSPSPSQTLLYFYFDFTDSRKQSFENTLRSLISQIYHHNDNAKRHLDSLYSSTYQGGKEKPSFESLQKTFTEMMGSLEEVWIVLDALDECTPRPELLSWLCNVHQDLSVQVNLHVLVTSRPEQDIKGAIQKHIRDEQMIPIRDDLLEADIRNYIQARVREHEGLSRWRGHKEIQDRIEASLIEKANGMFRWVSCQLDALENCLERKSLLKALQDLPRTLDETYGRILANIPLAYVHHTRRILQFLTYSERPLRLEEAVDAIAVDVGEDVARGCRFDPKDRLPVPEEITRYCSSLVMLTSSSRWGRYGEKQEVTEIQLAHFSVKDYLTSDRLENTTAHYLQEMAAQSSIAEVCLAYLLESQQIETAKDIKKVFPFAQYSARYWVSYGVIGEQNSELVFELVKELFLSRTLLEGWCRLYNPDRPWDNEPESNGIAPALYYASLLGLLRCSRMLLNQGADVNAQGGYYGNALQAASYGGYQEIVQILINNGADVNAKGGDYGNALYAASYGGHRDIVQLLLDGGAEINAQGGHYDNALQAASYRAHCEIVQTLLDRGADVNAESRHYGNALYAASEGGYQKIVQLLLDKGADVNAQGGYYGNALQAASRGGHWEIVQQLLDKGADVNAEGDRFGNALYTASQRGHQDIVQLLLDKGADVNAQGGEYGNALQAASIGGHREIVQLLLDKGADVNAQGGEYDNALYAASIGGHREIVQLLLDKGADVNTQGGYYGNALCAASNNRHREIVQLLLDKGADVNAQGGKYGNALCAASNNRHREIVQLLLDKGADVNAQGGKYDNALYAASNNRHREIVQLLLDKGADVNAQGGEYDNALYAASIGGHREIVQLLLNKGADVNAQGGEYGNALQAASLRGDQGIVQILVDNGADVNAQGGEYGNALQAASYEGHQEIVQLLLDQGADVNAEGGEYGNALQAASYGGHQEIVQLLLDQGADVNAEGGEYGNALQAASYEGHREIVQLLIDNGADVNAEGGEYGNALQAASYEGHQEIVQLLIDNGADVDAEGGKYGNALQAASIGGHREIVQLLLDNGADVDAEGGEYGNALQAASYGGHQEIVQLLIDQGADVDAEGGKYGNALQAASYGGHQEIVQLLLDNGADVNAQGGFYGNALQAALQRGHREIVQLLLDQGADVNAQSGFYGNALQAASQRGHQEIVQLLLDQGADVNAQGGKYGNALQAASIGGHQEIVQLLLDQGADVNAQGGKYGNALQAASIGGHQEIMQILVDNGADVNAQGGLCGSALQAASERGHREIVQLLLDNGADVNAQGGYYGNALQAASARGHQEIVEQLKKAGALMGVVSTGNRT